MPYFLNRKLTLEAILNKKNRICFLLLALTFYILVAYNSVGYHQEDEHYQIIEFANYKLGTLPKNGLAWEFNSQIRPGLQPMICFGLFKLWIFLGVTDVYILAFLLRVVTAIFSTWVIARFINHYKRYIADSLQIYFFLFSFFLWFLPYVNIRFSSETWSGLVLLLILIFVDKHKEKSQLKYFILIGLLMGCAILFRYQSAMFVCGIYLWLYIIGKDNFRQLGVSFLALLLVLGVGVLIDYWLYGELTFSIYHYFNVNIIQGVANQFGVLPFYQYIVYILTAPGPIGILILGSFFVLWYYNHKNLLLWTITPFLIVHSVIPHKELRFLFPLVNLCPIIFFLAFQNVWNVLKSYSFEKLYKGYLTKGIIAAIFILNVLGLFAITFTGAGKGKVAVIAYIHRNFGNKKVNVIENGNVSPYMDWAYLRNTFYNSSSVHVDKISDVWQPDFLTHKKSGYINLLVIYQKDITGPRELQYMKDVGLVKVYQNIPYLITLIYRFYNSNLNDNQILVYKFNDHFIK
jgi:phosphatidylinositol glycan class B